MIGSASPIVQNRIKTNGSLPREKKNLTTSPTSPNGSSYDFNSPSSPDGNSLNNSHHHQRASEYENVDQKKYLNLPLKDAPQSPGGYENVFLLKKNIPQSPRTRIKTCISPQTKKEEPPVIPPKPKTVIPENHANEYDAIIRSFEEKLKVEISLLQNREAELSRESREIKTDSDTSKSSSHNNSDTLLEKQKERIEIIKNIRHLKTMIADLQNQEEEVMREMDVEKALVNAELTSEHDFLIKFDAELTLTQSNLHRAETQRNSNRVMQETNQAKLKQAIDVKQEHLKR